MTLTDKNILVTGASKGIGYAIADYLMQNGANVAVHFNSGEDAARELIIKYPNTKSRCFQADLSKPESVKTLFNEVLIAYENLDSLVLNAGVFLAHHITNSIDDWFEVWKKTLAINLDSVGLLTKLGIDHFKSQASGGRFVYIGSRATFRGETQEYLAYAASKGGLTSLARSVARSFGKDNIKAFVVAPGFTRTQMAEAFINTYGEERILSEIALNELTRPEDIAPLVGLMCSGQMDHATGATIDVNAGSHIR
jgi:NAD(P)-dependent dehydrogenase (short-subunit alcohol dehydrogenase family)